MAKSKHMNAWNTRKKFFLGVLTVPILFSLLLSSCNFFARFGGESVSTPLIPTPPNGELRSTIYATDRYSDYVLKHSVYTNSISADKLRDWYIDVAYVNLSPIPTADTIIEYDGYFGTPHLFGRSNILKRLHTLSVWLTTDWFDEFIATCQRVRVYFDIEQFKIDFPDVEIINEDITLTVVTTCWPNVG